MRRGRIRGNGRGNGKRSRRLVGGGDGVSDVGGGDSGGGGDQLLWPGLQQRSATADCGCCSGLRLWPAVAISYYGLACSNNQRQQPAPATCDCSLQQPPATATCDLRQSPARIKPRAASARKVPRPCRRMPKKPLTEERILPSPGTAASDACGLSLAGGDCLL